MTEITLNELYKMCESLHERVSNHSDLLHKIINGLTSHGRDIEELKTIVFTLCADMQSMNGNNDQSLH